jgi:hypothetical protein
VLSDAQVLLLTILFGTFSVNFSSQVVPKKHGNQNGFEVGVRWISWRERSNMSPLEVSNWEAFLTTAFAVVLMGFYGYLFYRIDRYVRRKGYHSPFRGFVFMLTYLMMWAVGFIFVSQQSGTCWSCNPADNPERFLPELLWPHVQQFISGFWVATTGVLGVTALAARALPRAARRAGARRVTFPWKAASFACLGCWVLVAILGVSGIVRSSTSYKLSGICITGYVSFAYLAKRQKSIPLEQLRSSDTRQPVLYLRSFDLEEDPFTTVPNRECAAIDVPVRNRNALRQVVTFEEYLSKEISREIGPFVALGNPYDYLPPAGAARVYTEDDRWRDQFCGLARDGICIVTTPGHSDNLKWELRTIRSEGFQKKLFVLTGPALRWPWFYSPRWWHSLKREWAEFATDLRSCGLVTGEYPGAGATVGFDDEGKGVVVGTNARAPSDYVSSVQNWLRLRDERQLEG